MSTIPQLSHATQTVLTTATAAAARTLHSTRRTDQATLTASTLIQTLVFG